MFFRVHQERYGLLGEAIARMIKKSLRLTILSSLREDVFQAFFGFHYFAVLKFFRAKSFKRSVNFSVVLKRRIFCFVFVFVLFVCLFVF